MDSRGVLISSAVFEFQNNRKIQWKAILTKLGTVVVLVLFVVVTKAAWNAFQKEKQSQENLAETRRELLRIEERFFSISEDVDNLRTDRGMEAAIREKFPVAKEGEKIIVILNDGNKEEERTEDERSWWHKLLFWKN